MCLYKSFQRSPLWVRPTITGDFLKISYLQKASFSLNRIPIGDFKMYFLWKSRYPYVYWRPAEGSLYRRFFKKMLPLEDHWRFLYIFWMFLSMYLESFEELRPLKFNNFSFFSIANFPPNYQDHINPPARFSDEKSSNKSQTSPRVRSNSKLQRETFQINV